MGAPSDKHLTVRFLGEVDDEDVPTLIGSLEQLRATACELLLRASGTFGPAARTRVVWLGGEGEESCLGRLIGAVNEALAGVGLKHEQEPWRPHLTLARMGHRASIVQWRAVAALVRTLLRPGATPFVADSLALNRSHLGNGPARYELLTFGAFRSTSLIQ